MRRSSGQRSALVGVAVVLAAVSAIAISARASSSGTHKDAGITSAATAAAPSAPASTVADPSAPPPTDCTDPRLTDCTPGERQAAAQYKAQQPAPSQPLMTKDEAIQAATSPASAFATYTTTDRVASRLVKLSDLRSRLGSGAIYASDDNDPAWVVVVSGKIQSYSMSGVTQSADTDPNFSWALTAYDAKTHAVALFYAGRTSWPGFWDSLPALPSS